MIMVNRRFSENSLHNLFCYYLGYSASVLWAAPKGAWYVNLHGLVFCFDHKVTILSRYISKYSPTRRWIFGTCVFFQLWDNLNLLRGHTLWYLISEQDVISEQGGAKISFSTWKKRSGWCKNFKIVKRLQSNSQIREQMSGPRIS